MHLYVCWFPNVEPGSTIYIVKTIDFQSWMLEHVEHTRISSMYDYFARVGTPPETGKEVNSSAVRARGHTVLRVFRSTSTRALLIQGCCCVPVYILWYDLIRVPSCFYWFTFKNCSWVLNTPAMDISCAIYPSSLRYIVAVFFSFIRVVVNIQMRHVRIRDYLKKLQPEHEQACVVSFCKSTILAFNSHFGAIALSFPIETKQGHNGYCPAGPFPCAFHALIPGWLSFNDDAFNASVSPKCLLSLSWNFVSW